MESPYSFTLDPDIADNARFQDLVRYWNRKRGARTAALKSDIDPLELKGHLGSLNVIECLPKLADFRYRLIGSRIAEAYGRDSTGRTVRELYEVADPAYCEFLLHVYTAVATRRVIARITATLRTVNKDYRSADSLLLPLDRGDGAVGFILNEVLFQ